MSPIRITLRPTPCITVWETAGFIPRLSKRPIHVPSTMAAQLIRVPIKQSPSLFQNDKKPPKHNGGFLLSGKILLRGRRGFHGVHADLLLVAALALEAHDAVHLGVEGIVAADATFRPGWMWVPRWRTRMLPAREN